MYIYLYFGYSAQSEELLFLFMAVALYGFQVYNCKVNKLPEMQGTLFSALMPCPISTPRIGAIIPQPHK